MVIKHNGKVEFKTIETYEDVIPFAKEAEKLRMRWLKYSTNHSATNKTASSYRSNWRYANNEFNYALDELCDNLGIKRGFITAENFLNEYKEND